MDLLKRVYLVFFFLVLGVVLGAGACGFDPQIADGAFACAADRSCPTGFVCAGDNKCYRPGNGPPVPTIDGGNDGPDSSPPLVISKLQAEPISLAEGNSSVPTDFVFTVRLDPPSAREVTVDYATNDGTAKVNEDYAGAAGKLTFPPGSTAQTVTVKVIADRFEEPDEAFKLTLSNPVNAEFLPGGGPEIAATIKNDDTPGLAIDDVTIVEGDTDTTATLTVSLSGTFTTDVTVGFETLPLAAGGATVPATEGEDYNTTSDILTFTPGTKTLQIVVPIKGDFAHEKVEAFLVKLSNPVGAPLVDDEATVTITDNDPIPTVTIAPATSAEGDVGTTNMTFVVTLSAATSEVVKVNFATGGGTAATTDYSATNGILTFPAGTITQNVSVPVNGDLIDEADETFNVTLSAPVNATLGTAAVGIGTITDDDAAPVLTVGDVSLAEGNAGTTTFSFPFTLSAPSAKTITISYATANGTATAGTDFANAAGNVTFVAGETSKMVDVLVTGDTVPEPTRSFTLTLSNPQNVTPPIAAPVGTIINDDGAAMTLSIDNVAIAEGNAGTKVATFTVSCAGTGNWSVSYSTSNGTAAGDSDFVAITAPVALPTVSCASTQTISVTVNGDNEFEVDETFTVNLSNPSADVAIVDSQGLGTITNDDSPPTINIASTSGTEGNVGSKVFGFDVTLTNPASTAVTVNYATGAGVTNPATAGSDYVTTSGTLTFAPGETSKTINVTVNGDAVYELDETFQVTLSANSANSTLGTSVATGTITNDEAQPTVSISDATSTEGNSGTKNFTFDVTLSGESSQMVTVAYATTDGTATAPSDYTAKTGTVTWNPGDNLTQTVTISVVGDGTFEASETFNVGLSNPVNTTITDNAGLGTITNDDQARLVSINDVSVTENNGNGYIEFTISVSPTATGTTSVTWTVVHLTTSNSDFTTTPLTGVANITSGQSSTNVRLNINNDSLDELDEQFEVHLSNPTNNSQIGDGVGIGTITDNDNPPTVSVVGPANSIDEGDSGTKLFTFNVNLNTASGRTVTVQYATRDGSARSSNPGKDYNSQSGTLTFAPGVTTQQIQVEVIGDTNGESDENFFVDISNADGATISTASDSAVINNDD